MSAVVRTPDDRFEGLPGWTFEPRYLEVDGLRIHYVDEGPRDADPILLLHGEPSWSYVYRTMIPPLATAGHRVVAIDLIGFGRSDKLTDPDAYSYRRHVDWMHEALTALDLRAITVFGQDWGGLIGLRLAAEQQERFARIVAANTFLPTGDRRPPEIWFAFREHMRTAPEVHIGGLVASGCVTRMSDEVKAAYDAPFPDEASKAGARAFPGLVPVTPEDPAVAANLAACEVLRRWEKPFLTLFGDSDPITRGADRALQKLIPGCAGQPHATIERAGHFLQEDQGPVIAQHLLSWLS